jgi:uncharacterized protein
LIDRKEGVSRGDLRSVKRPLRADGQHDPVVAAPALPDATPERVLALRDWLQAASSRPVRLIETHISWVLLADTLAYKLKKPVRLPFLDFTTLDARRHFCAEELRVNRRFAPDLYLDVVDVCAGPSGPVVGGPGRVLDVALRMRRFPDDALWSDMLVAGTLGPDHVDAMAQRLVGFHRGAAVAAGDSKYGSAPVHERVTRRLVAAIDAWPAAAASAADWPALRAWLERQLHELAPQWEARRRAGRVRECHGDLHLANVVQLGDTPTAFDAIEFDPELRWIDVLDDVAFLAMDLLAHDRRGLAFRFLNACLEAGGDYDGLPVLRFCMVARALVRAVVASLTEGQGAAPPRRPGAAEYLALAANLARGSDARLMITHGLPGSGKTFVSQGILETAGAIRARSDVERKRLFGLGPLDSSRELGPIGIYDASTTARTYARLHEIARLALAAGWPVVIDAAFLRRAERARFAGLAAELGVPFSIAECRAPWSLLRQRIALRQARGVDASEADLAVLERLRGADDPLDASESRAALVADAASPVAPAVLARRWLAAR